MTAYLLDTNVVSETRKLRPNPGLLSWLTHVDAGAAWLSSVVIGELDLGITRLAGTDAKRARELRTWLDNLSSQFSDRILPVNVTVARAWGHIGAQQTLAVAGALIAATAVAHDLTLVTRNISDFADLPVRLHNPFSQ